MKKFLWYVLCFLVGVLLSFAFKSEASDEPITDTEVEAQYQEMYQDSPIEGVVLEPVDE
jgi:hypothetical protein|nr:MAG TPA: beta-lactamase [Caudoviricetes sp.]